MSSKNDLDDTVLKMLLDKISDLQSQVNSLSVYVENLKSQLLVTM